MRNSDVSDETQPRDYRGAPKHGVFFDRTADLTILTAACVHPDGGLPYVPIPRAACLKSMPKATGYASVQRQLNNGALEWKQIHRKGPRLRLTPNGRDQLMWAADHAVAAANSLFLLSSTTQTMLRDRKLLAGPRAKQMRAMHRWHVLTDGHRRYPWMLRGDSVLGRLEKVPEPPYVWVERVADLTLLAAAASADFAEDTRGRFCAAADAKAWAWALGVGESASEYAKRALLREGYVSFRSRSQGVTRLLPTPAGLKLLERLCIHGQEAAAILRAVGLRGLEAVAAASEGPPPKEGACSLCVVGTARS